MKFLEKLFNKKSELEEKLSFIVEHNKEKIVLAHIVFETGETDNIRKFWVKTHAEYNKFSIKIAREMAEWIIKMTGDSVLEEIKEIKEMK